MDFLAYFEGLMIILVLALVFIIFESFLFFEALPSESKVLSVFCDSGDFVFIFIFSLLIKGILECTFGIGIEDFFYYNFRIKIYIYLFFFKKK